MIEFCILGSGMAGSTIANLLSKKSSVEIFDKARGAGGRSSNRRFKNGASFDHGLQYIFPKSNIILALRHPGDTGFSCFSSSFTINEAMINFLKPNV